eukprot:TRINITY_DN3911_c0_g1_i1.p1 TRINITY_DN3911_c0_g1~~TRINITY_DN3911_c0_g1_i1.p1  ORF type:complete len:102 (+),score=29.03 TRINITY_DN3911_c0_g1_i1:52-357(+)
MASLLRRQMLLRAPFAIRLKSGKAPKYPKHTYTRLLDQAPASFQYNPYDGLFVPDAMISSPSPAKIDSNFPRYFNIPQDAAKQVENNDRLSSPKKEEQESQ